tara:strand:+ start:14307 stop:17771 length:3465 start_codon:yes stop_codon:yes gene_type:complete
MPEFNKRSVFKKPLLYGFLAFLMVLIITQTITNQRFKIENQNEQNKVNERALKLGEDLQGILGQSSTATQTLAFIVENYGIPENFDSIAQLLINSNKNIDALELVNRDGVITHVYPLAGNEVLGLNIFKDSIGKDGAITTLERKDYFTAGPIDLNQGGSGFVGRRPLFNEDGFNGFVAAVIRLSTVIRAVEKDLFDDPLFYYQLSKINPNKTEEVFYSSKDISKGEAINVPLTTSQGEWKLYVISNQPASYSTTIIFSILGFLLSLVCGILVWFLVRQPFKLNQLVKEKTLLLKKGQQEYKALIEQASDGIIVTNVSGDIVDVNLKAVEMLGYTKEELNNKNLTDIIHPEDLKNNPIRFTEFIKGKSVLTERRLVRKDGSEFFVEVNAKLQANKTIQGILRDINKRKFIETENKKLIAIVENSPGFIGLATLSGTPLYINDEGKKLVNFPSDKEFSKTSILDFFPKEFAETAEQEFLPTLFKTGIWNMEVPFQDFKTNSIVPVQISCFIVKDKVVNEPIGIGCIALDLREHKKKTQEMLALQSKMDAAIRIGKIGYWDYDIETENANWSPRLYEIYNVKPGTTITIPLLESLIHPDDVDLHRKVLKETIVENGTHSYTYRILDNNGSIKYLHIEMEADFNEEDLPVKLRGTVVDVTEQKEANNKILELQNKMDAAIRIGKIGYWSWDLENNLVDWSHEMFEIYGIPDKSSITLEEAIEFIHPEDSNVLAEVLSRKPEDDQTEATVYKICLKDKTVKHILSFNENVYNDQGEPIQLQGTAMDITGSVLAEEALRESQEKFSKAFQNNLMGMIMLNEERKVIEVNRTVCTITGLTREELLGKTILESGVVTIDEYDDVKREKLWKKLSEEGEIINQEFTITLKDGETKSLLVSIEPLYFNQKENYLINLIDNSKRKEAEEALKSQYIELKKTNSELDSFVYSASHELRAPLASILGLIQLILMEEQEPQLALHLNMMVKSIERLDDFIKDIIEYSRNKHVEIKLETINFTNLLEITLESLWYLENMSKIKVKISIDDKIDFASDNKRISILLNNFISNAIKYHDITKKAPSIWITIKTSKKEAIIEIKDNGLGMAEEQLDKIFDMFYRISSQIMGSGIGLFIVKEVLGKLNGTIEVKSVLGEGSTFTLKIPNRSNK